MCEHKWVHLRSASLRVMIDGAWKQDLYNKTVECVYDIFFCEKCLTQTKILYSDNYGGKPLERSEYVDDAR